MSTYQSFEELTGKINYQPKSTQNYKFCLVSVMLSTLIFVSIGYNHFHLSSSGEIISKFSNTYKNSIAYNLLQFDSKESTTEFQLLIVAENEYTLRGDRKVANYPWDIVEPFRETYLTVLGGSSDSKYIWSIKKVSDWAVDEYTDTYTGQFISTIFKNTGKYIITVQEVAEDSTILNTISNEYMSKYVRREIRTLTDDDRNRFFDAVQTLSYISTEEGQEIFGSNYLDKNWFIREHLYGGADIECDHWHSGTGFFPVHVAFTLKWEKSIQSVDPRVAAHYWDFTIDSEQLGYNWRESSVFDADWFGTASPSSSDGVLTEGRWAFTPVMPDAKEFSSITNSWGLLRSPWNNNPTPFMTRFNTLFKYYDDDKPKGCGEYHGCLHKKSWQEAAMCFNGDAHGRVHQLIGGSSGGKYDEFLNMDLLKDKTWSNETYRVGTFLIETEAFIKSLWREGYLICPSECSADTTESDCQCYCDRSTDIWKGKSAYQILNEVGILRKLYNIDPTGFVKRSDGHKESEIRYWLDGLSRDETHLVWEGLIDATCKPGYIGTMYEGESPNDITFWVLHTTMDRVWHWMRLSPYYYGFDDTWTDGKYGQCKGHYQNDISSNITNIFDYNHYGYTNKQLYDLLHPKNPNLPYVYDTFVWEHCEEKGFDFSNLISDWKSSGITNGGRPYEYEQRPSS